MAQPFNHESEYYVSGCFDGSGQSEVDVTISTQGYTAQRETIVHQAHHEP